MRGIIIPYLIRIVLAAVFLWAACHKLVYRNDSAFGSGTVFDEMIPSRTPAYFAVIGVEVALAAWLISGIRLRQGALTALLFLSFLSGVVAMEVTRSNPKPCGCFGESTTVQSSRAIRWSLVGSMCRNAALMGATAYLLLKVPRGTKRSVSLVSAAAEELQ